MKLQEINNLFENDSAYILGDLRRPHLQDTQQLHIGIHQSPIIYRDITFWCSDNIHYEWPLLQRSINNEIRVLTETDLKIQNQILYRPTPLWVFPDAEIQSWLKERDENECPVGYGSLSLAIGFSYCLGLRDLTLYGCHPKSEDFIYDHSTRGFIKLQNKVYQALMRNFEMALNLAAKLNIGIREAS